MEKSTWWIGLSREWEVIQRTSYDEQRPDINQDVHMWIKKQETSEKISTPNMKGEIVYEYSLWNMSFRRRELFPVNHWDITGLSTPLDYKLSKKVYIHLQDPLKIVRKILVDSDNSWNLSQAFTKIDYKISNFESWEEYEGQNS
jgi:hypothetical protein